MAFSTIAFGQSPAELASQAAQAMQDRNYAAAERLYAELAHLAPGVPEIYSNLGLARYSQKRFDAAESAFQAALRLNSQLFVPNFFLGKIYFEEGRYRSALPLLERALKLQPQQKAPRRLLAAVWVGLKHPDEALLQYQKLLEKDSRDVDSLYALAQIYLDLGKSAFRHLRNTRNACFTLLVLAGFDVTRGTSWQGIAADEYRKAIAACPQFTVLRVALGNLLLKSKEWEAAQKAFQEELRVDSYSAAARYGLAEIAFEQGNLDSAERNLNEAARIRPEFFDPLPDLSRDAVHEQLATNVSSFEAAAGQNSFGALFLLSVFATAQGESGQAASWRRKAEEARDQLIRENERRFQRFSRKPLTPGQRRAFGLQYLREKRYEEGIQILSPMIQRNPSDHDLRMAVVQALFTLGRYEKTCKILSEVHIDDPESFYFLGASYKKLALAALEKIDEINPHSAPAHQLLGEIYFAREMFPEAAREYETALKIQPDRADLYYALGNAYFKQMKFETAAQAYAQAVKLNPFDAQACLMEGSSFVQLHEPGKAVPVLNHALQLDEHLLEAQAELGKALAQLNRPEEAVRHLELAAGTDADGSLHYQIFELYRKLGEQEKASGALRASEKIRREKQEAIRRNLQNQ